MLGDGLCLLLQRYTFWSNSQPIEEALEKQRNCACYCKDTHFEAIHNALPRIGTIKVIVLATAKIHILKQFTTIARILSSVKNCACYCKDTHFEAIHNKLFTLSTACFIVLATAKIHILKQFTTKLVAAFLITLLCLLLQRYTFWSNSQLIAENRWKCINCACYCKDTHFEAIHNSSFSCQPCYSIVLATAKIHILKQFTTCFSNPNTSGELCLLLQRYTFWSNSQLDFRLTLWTTNCACYCKDTHFEAIHNSARLSSGRVWLCLLLQRYTFWSNSQLWIRFFL